MTIRELKDRLSHRLLFLLSLGVLCFVFVLAWGLYTKAVPILQSKGMKELFFSSAWNPSQGEFGLAAFLVGTAWVTAIALMIAVPLSLLTAIYLSEFCSGRMREIIKPLLDLLAGISPVVYGVWGMLVIVPWVGDHWVPFFNKYFPFFPFLSDNYTGFSAMSAGIVLSVMISPIIISVIEEVMGTIPMGMREAALCLGATRWQVTKTVIIKKAKPAIVAAVILGLSRALGETMAVLMIAGCAMGAIARSMFDSVYPLTALIANTYGEMMSIPLYASAVFLSALILLIITVGFNMIAWGMLLYIERREGG